MICRLFARRRRLLLENPWETTGTWTIRHAKVIGFSTVAQSKRNFTVFHDGIERSLRIRGQRSSVLGKYLGQEFDGPSSHSDLLGGIGRTIRRSEPCPPAGGLQEICAGMIRSTADRSILNTASAVELETAGDTLTAGAACGTSVGDTVSGTVEMAGTLSKPPAETIGEVKALAAEMLTAGPASTTAEAFSAAWLAAKRMDAPAPTNRLEPCGKEAVLATISVPPSTAVPPA